MTLNEKNEFLKQLDEADFRDLGAPHIAYLREIEWLGATHFAVHSADGAALVIAPNRTAALDVIHAQDMEAVTLH